MKVPAGDAKNDDNKVDKSIQLKTKNLFVQNQSSTCLVDSFSSALVQFGFVHQGKKLHEMNKKLNQDNVELMNDFVKSVNSLFHGFQLCLVKVSKHGTKTTLESNDLLKYNDSFPLVVTLNNNKGMTGQHAISIFNNTIFDATSNYCLTKSQKSLDWCVSGGEPNVVCTSVEEMYQLQPRCKDFELKSWMFDSMKRGWISNRKKGKLKVMFVDGSNKLYKDFSELVQLIKNSA